MDIDLQKKYLGKLYEEQFGKAERAIEVLTAAPDGQENLQSLMLGGFLQPRDKELRLSTAGIVFVEHENLAAAELVAHHHKVREAVLKTLAEVHQDNNGKLHQAELGKRCAITDRDFHDNVELLLELKWIQVDGLACYRIGPAGLLVAKGLKMSAEHGGRGPL